MIAIGLSFQFSIYFLPLIYFIYILYVYLIYLGGRRRQNSNSSGGEGTPSSKKTIVAENNTVLPINRTSTLEVNSADFDNSSLEVIDVSTGERLRPEAGDDAALTAKAARMATKNLLGQGRQPREIVDGKIGRF